MDVGHEIIDLHHPAFFLGKTAFVHLVRIVVNHVVGRLDNLVGRSIVFLEPENPGILVLVRESQKMVDVGPPEPVDRLPVVPHTEQIPVAAHEQGG